MVEGQRDWEQVSLKDGNNSGNDIVDTSREKGQAGKWIPAFPMDLFVSQHCGKGLLSLIPSVNPFWKYPHSPAQRQDFTQLQILSL